MKKLRGYLLPVMLVTAVFALRYHERFSQLLLWVMAEIPYGHRLRYLVKWLCFFILGMAFAIFPDGKNRGLRLNKPALGIGILMLLYFTAAFITRPNGVNGGFHTDFLDLAFTKDYSVTDHFALQGVCIGFFLTKGIYGEK